MEKIVCAVTDLIGHTPLLRLTALEKKYGLKGELVAKVEALNPAGSIKDRAALFMIDDAEKKGLLKPHSTIIEPTSGNTGIGLCAIAAARGYKAIIVMPDSMSKERIALMKAYGAQVILTEGSKGMAGCIEKAEALHREIERSFIPDQFNNPANAEAHYQTTGPEIFEDTEGKVDFLVAGIGTGGTITGVGRYLKERIPSIRVIGVEPSDSPLLSEGKAGSHALQGIGANFIPSILDQTVYDEISPITTGEAYEMVRATASAEGLLIGISGGAALAAAKKLAEREENSGKRFLVILPDGGERYLSTGVFD